MKYGIVAGRERANQNKARERAEGRRTSRFFANRKTSALSAVVVVDVLHLEQHDRLDEFLLFPCSLKSNKAKASTITMARLSYSSLLLLIAVMMMMIGARCSHAFVPPVAIEKTAVMRRTNPYYHQPVATNHDISKADHSFENHSQRIPSFGISS